MATNVTKSQSSATGSAAAVQTALAKEAGVRRQDVSSNPAKPTGYGLPCAKCRLYYPADLDVCPTCHHNQRVSPVVPKLPAKPAQAAPERIPDNSTLEKEREEFLRQFKSQLMEAHSGVVNAPESVCKLREHHAKEPASAEICGACYEQLQERVDICDAALHIEIKEAAQIIYDAVWADPSDPNKTYQNAASALLAELRKRAGLSSVLSPFQPLGN
ncbi:MAG TPA: hypothetical protein VMD76_03075 [Candidatus Sulfotelmatobacter sp.]|jgi:hypothetical protein|nr:hypothetical protein [Candidatus Sulfotelmatobacter sp.]